jgi:hypothetical protein
LSAIVDAHNFVIIQTSLPKPLKIVSDPTHFAVEKGVDGVGRLPPIARPDAVEVKYRR